MPTAKLQSSLATLPGAMSPTSRAVSYGGITININDTQGMDKRSLTDEIMNRLMNELMNGEAAYA